MSTLHSIKNSISALWHDRGGNFAMMTAILLPVSIGAASLAIDITNATMSQRQLQDAADSAALATASALAAGKIDTTGASAYAKDFVGGQMANYMSDTTAVKNATTVTATKTTSSTATSYNVSVSANYSLQLSGLAQVAGFKATNVAALSKTASGTDQTKSALSMELLLDQSGSMAYDTTTCSVYKKNSTTKCKTYVIKMDALKAAAAKLFDALDTADPTHVLVRTGVMSYANGLLRDNSDKIKSVSAMDWGTSASRSYVSTLSASGGTDATEPMQQATTAIKKTSDGKDTESVQHANKGNTNADRYIVLMTDGEMTGNSSEWNSAKDANVRAACDAAKTANVTIFTVAFMAPDKGKSLLKYCASSTSNYFEAETMENLIDDFDSIAQTATQAITRLTN
ncbi:pilus assembly protein TadG-related protein [Rhizobium sp. 18055]|uniref:pilus assembly protein TadG-related protein n=1 Tax=Rhizobium sp. 18055 TaxID=2681403 RepID=UPI0027B9C809|nr:pilus assembly protein TadG-related protein [Rhizobium sp. 18055]